MAQLSGPCFKSPGLTTSLCVQIYVQDGLGGSLRQVVAATPGSPLLDPQISPDGTAIAFVCEDELFVASTEPGKGGPRQLTFGAKEKGVVSFKPGLI